MTVLTCICFHVPAFHNLVGKGAQRRESIVVSNVANIVYKKLEKEAKEREELVRHGYSVEETSVPTIWDQPTPSDAKKRGLSQVNGDDVVGASPPKLLKMSSAPEDEMEVEGAVSLAARDFMDLDCGDVPALEMQECTYETCDHESLGAEYDVRCKSIPTKHSFSLHGDCLCSD